MLSLSVGRGGRTRSAGRGTCRYRGPRLAAPLCVAAALVAVGVGCVSTNQPRERPSSGAGAAPSETLSLPLRTGAMTLATVRRLGCVYACARYTAALYVGRRRTLGPFHLYDSRDVDLSFDGRTFAYCDWRGRIRIVNLTNKRQRVISAGQDPRFSPDGRYLAFESGAAYDVAVYSMRAASARAAGKRTKLSGDFSWAHHSDRLAGHAHGGLGVVLASAPAQIQLARRIHATQTASTPNWDWKDSGLLYWLLGSTGRASLISWSLRKHRQSLIASFAGAFCGKTCNWQAAPLPMARGVVSLQPPPPGSALFGFVVAGHMRGVSVRRTSAGPLAGVRSDPTGSRLLASWSAYEPASGGERDGVALWIRGHRQANEIGPWLDAFWVERGRARKSYSRGRWQGARNSPSVRD
jgi:hypothetical protein